MCFGCCLIGAELINYRPRISTATSDTCECGQKQQRRLLCFGGECLMLKAPVKAASFRKRINADGD